MQGESLVWKIVYVGHVPDIDIAWLRKTSPRLAGFRLGYAV